MSGVRDDQAPERPAATGAAQAGLADSVYRELHALAARHMRRERPDHTLQTTALVHEAYLRLIKQKQLSEKDRQQFLELASWMIERVLVDHARPQGRAKRGRGWNQVMLEDAAELTRDWQVDALALHEAMEKLGGVDERQRRVVELRFFAGLELRETADIRGVSRRTVCDDWRMARAWLRRALTEAAPRG